MPINCDNKRPLDTHEDVITPFRKYENFKIIFFFAKNRPFPFVQFITKPWKKRRKKRKYIQEFNYRMKNILIRLNVKISADLYSTNTLPC